MRVLLHASIALALLASAPGRNLGPGGSLAPARVQVQPSPGNPELLTRRWEASWIVAAGTNPFGFGVYHFRKTLDVPTLPRTFVVHVTADNRYQLWVNGTRVAWGPARGDLNHWRYETVDLAPHLRAGRNVVAAVVWNYGELAPEAQTTWRTGFLVQGDTAAEKAVNTGVTWKAIADAAYSPIPFTHAQLRGYYVVGPGERLEAAKHPWGWETAEFDDSAWPAAQPAVSDGRANGAPRAMQDAPNRWLLVPRSIPLMEERVERVDAVRQSLGVVVPSSFPRAAAAFTIPPRTHARLLLDNARLTTAYPVLSYGGGAGASIRIGYAESLYVPRGGGRRAEGGSTGSGAAADLPVGRPAQAVPLGQAPGDKGNRNEVEGKEFVGNYDLVIADGAQHRRYSPLWWRTYRYVEMTIDTQADPLTIEDFHGIYTGYPFDRRQRIEALADSTSASSPVPRRSSLLPQILDVGWRTARLCAHESYMDCPYYEQLQYAGDTRIQALVSLYTAGDSRLVKNAISLLNDSRTAEGATMSRAPTRQQQYIPPFSLWWIGMVHDYHMYVDDQPFVREMLPGVRAVLQFFAQHQKANGSLGPMPWWNYVDWTTEWEGGVPPHEADGSSAPLDLQLLLAYDWAADLEQALGSASLAAEDRAAAARLRETARSLYWDAGRRLFADTPAASQKAGGSSRFSQHSNVLAVLAGVATGGEARDLVVRILGDSTLTQCSYYFKHYLHSAVNMAGEGDRYVDLLGEWESMLARGLTTFAERYERPGDPSRSDCHAWSASPNFEIFRTVLGIDTAAPGFARVRVRPFPGRFARVAGSIPHPKGEVSVKLERAGNGLRAEVSLPPGVSGEFEWRGATRALNAGPNVLEFQ